MYMVFLCILLAELRTAPNPELSLYDAASSDAILNFVCKSVLVSKDTFTLFLHQILIWSVSHTARYEFAEMSLRGTDALSFDVAIVQVVLLLCSWIFKTRSFVYVILLITVSFSMLILASAERYIRYGSLLHVPCWTKVLRCIETYYTLIIQRLHIDCRSTR